MQVNPAAKGHHSSNTCKTTHAAKLQWKAVSNSIKALEAKFFVYDVELKRVEVFKYWGRLIACNDGDTQAGRGNLWKARCVWASIPRVLRA